MKKGLIASSLLLTVGCSAAKEEEKPNFVVFFVDDLGWADLGYQNPKFDTPNINQLKEQGLYFSRNYVSTATSSPSRSSLITGKEALRCGFVRHIYGEPNGGRSEFELLATDPGVMKSRSWLPLSEITYAERLKECGYYNFFVGKWHLGPEEYYPDKQGFDAMFGCTDYGSPKSYYAPYFKSGNPFTEAEKGAYLSDILAKGASDFIATYDKESPFLLNYWFYNVHSPHIGRKDYVAEYMKKGYSKVGAIYAAQVRSMDDAVGTVRKALEAKGIADNTVIIFTSDQGGAYQNAHLRGGKMGGETLCEGGSRVPMIVYAPGMKNQGGATYTKPVTTMDVFPTLVELATGEPCTDKQLNGMSLVPILEGGEQPDRTIHLYRSYEDQNSSIIQGDWKLIKYRSGKTLLFNLASDEAEQNDLSATQTERTSKMLSELLAWEKDAIPAELVTKGTENTYVIHPKKPAAKKKPGAKGTLKK